jgi:hypothetical protein
MGLELSPCVARPDMFCYSYLLGSCLRAHSFTAIPGREYFSVRIGYTNYTSIPGRNGSWSPFPAKRTQPKWVVLKWDHAGLGRTADLAIYGANIYVYHHRTHV